MSNKHCLLDDFPSKLSLEIQSLPGLLPKCKHCVTSYIVNEAIPERGSHGFQMSNGLSGAQT